MKSLNLFVIDMKSEVFLLIFIILLFIFIMDSFIKLKENRVNGNLLNLIINFLEARKKRVVLKDQFLGLFSLYLLMTFLTT